ncbi:conserved hypothetical protein [Syntrophobacter sp. SbD1]|nr:conserved hypothetical protein [Syntrophobacter sp. SbD1]
MASEEELSAIKTWSIIAAIAVGFLAWGMLIYFVIGDKGPPGWDFSVIPDIPGQSVYSSSSPIKPHGLVPGPESTPVEPQHVSGPVSEAQRMEAPK